MGSLAGIFFEYVLEPTPKPFYHNFPALGPVGVLLSVGSFAGWAFCGLDLCWYAFAS